MSLRGKTKAATFKDLLQVDNANNGIGALAKVVKDGEGNSSSLSLSDDACVVKPINDDTTTLFRVKDKDNNGLFSVDSANDLVKAGIGLNVVNTQFKLFGLWEFAPSSGKHFILTTTPMIYGNGSTVFTGKVNGADWGGSATNPVDSLAIGSAGLELVPSLWILQQNITIDSIQYTMASSGASSIGIQVMSYDVVTGAGATAGDLSNGVVMAQTGANASSITPIVTGDDRISNGTLTINTANVDSGTAILLFGEASDADKMTIQTTIKYHLR